MTNSRPDIMTAVSHAATESTKPTEKDYKNLLKIVWQTPNEGNILYPRSDEYDNHIHLKAYVDAAYMSHEDANSHTGLKSRQRF